MALFADSTQRRGWLFPAARLAALRAAPPPPRGDGGAALVARRLSAAEAAAVRVHFETKIAQLCSALDAPRAVEATARSKKSPDTDGSWGGRVERDISSMARRGTRRVDR